jgi:hypothetical protein
MIQPRRSLRPAALLLTLTLAAPILHARPPHACTAVVFEGQVSAGHEWNSPLGEGWTLRLIPISPATYSGWDLVVDRTPPAGFPDALLLATPPYNSISEREIGTTFGLRAQDAIGWNPRSFRFLTNPVAFRQAQQLYLNAFNPSPTKSTPAPTKSPKAAITRLLALEKTASSGQLRILDAHLTPGAADPAPYAQNWALASARTDHQIDPGKESPQGSLNWIRFRISLTLPAPWRLAPGLHSTPSACTQ